MRVEKVLMYDGKTRYMLVNTQGDPVQAVLSFLRFKDNSGMARNTLRAYCYHLKLYFEFLDQQNLDYREAGIDEMAEFLRWLQNPFGTNKVTPMTPVTSSRTAGTCNTIISTVLNFYDYLMRHEDYSIQLSERLKRSISGSRRGFKGFLYHIDKKKEYPAKMLKVKEPKRRPQTITKDQVNQVVDSCVNPRDKFLIVLLWETGIRIGEALALWLEDFEVDACRVHIRDRGELSNFAEIKTVCSPRTIDVSVDLINMFLDYAAVYHTDDVDTNHVFIKVSGPNINQPMEYPDVTSLFNRLKVKTGIPVLHPHILRHSSLDVLRKAGWQPEKVQKRAGHAHVQTTMNEYFHVTDKELRDEWVKTQERIKLKKTGKDCDIV